MPTLIEWITNFWSAGVWKDEGSKSVLSLPPGFSLQLQQVSVPRPPAVVLPGNGSLAVMPSGEILSLGAGGEVYRDGEQLPGVAARQVVQFGLRIYAQGKTNPLWWRWTGSGWVQVLNFDPLVLVP